MCSDFGLPLGGGESVVTPTNPHVSATDSASTTADAEDLLLLPAIKIGKNAKDITGQRFGRLVALRPVRRDNHQQVYWLFKCDCGSVTVVYPGGVYSGATKSCGCLNSEVAARRQFIDIAGQTFGRLTVLRLSGTRYRSVYEWVCRCSCGRECVVNGNKLRTGHTTSCGCLAAEQARQRIIAWHAVLPRKGENSSRWNASLTDADREQQRQEMICLRPQAFLRDGYRCTCCGAAASGRLNAHHMALWSRDKARRTDLDNLITLCQKCHKAYHRKYPAKVANTDNFIEWFREQKIIVDTAAAKI